MGYFRRHYVPQGHQRTDPDASPLLVSDLGSAPVSLIITAGHDPSLHDEGAAYADRLREAGTKVVYRDFPQDMHGFATLPALTSGDDALREIASFLSGLR
ncbi:alpha/beta hydrolase fold domain-containing protein [Rhizobium lusitanum]|nr:alpha/beta hydrolase fold domain-containing protein [Rhizobium lusitanum]